MMINEAVARLEPQPLPKVLWPLLTLQFGLDFALVITGVVHIIVLGYLRYLCTGIYVGVIAAAYTLAQMNWTSLNRGKQDLMWIGAVIVIILCVLNVPLVAVISLALGDAYGQQTGWDSWRSCEGFGWRRRLECAGFNEANKGAIAVDAFYLILGPAAGALTLVTVCILWRERDIEETITKTLSREPSLKLKHPRFFDTQQSLISTTAASLPPDVPTPAMLPTPGEAPNGYSYNRLSRPHSLHLPIQQPHPQLVRQAPLSLDTYEPTPATALLPSFHRSNSRIHTEV